MAKITPRLHFLAVQLIVISIGLIFVKGNGSFFSGLKSYTGSMARSVVRVPSKVMDGSQYATHKVAGGIGRLVSPVRPLEKMVNAGGGLMSNLLGSGSRLLGKSVDEPRRVMFLYDRPLEWLGGSQQFRESVYVVLGHVLNNVVLHADDMEDGKRTIALGRMPVLGRVAKKLKNAGADKQDVETIVRLLGRNGLADLPESLESTVVGVFKNKRGEFRNTGLIDELYFIKNHINGFYRLNDNERTDYKLKTDVKYSRCTVLQPPPEDMETQ